MGSDYSPLYIASVVAAYWFISISMVYINKVLMSNKGVSISAPLFVTWFQCVVTTLICWFAGAVGERARAHPTTQGYEKVAGGDGSGSNGSNGSNGADASDATPKKTFFTQFPKAEYHASIGRRILPLSIIFVGMITFNNLCLKWVEVSFYNVARSLTIVFNVFFTYLILGSTSSCKTILCLLIVIAGFFVGSWGEVNFSVLGTLAGVTSSLFVSLNSIFTKKVLPVVDDNHWKLTFYNNVNASVMFLPLIWYFEGEAIMEARDEQLQSQEFWIAMWVAGFFGFAIGIVTVLQIKATSPLSHNISGTAKSAVQSMMAFYIWGNPATFLGILGIFVVLGGSLLYTVVKMSESKAPPPPPQAPPSANSTSSEKDGDIEAVGSPIRNGSSQ